MSVNTQSYMQLAPGSILNGKYQIESVIGEGGFGITYRGRDTLLDMPVAIKEYFPYGYAVRNSTVSSQVEISQVQQFQDMKQKFLTEARTLAMFSSIPAIVNVRDFFEENGTAYIVMEFLEGITLKQYVTANGAVDCAWLCTLMLPLLNALDAIHARGLIHRDISPDNIMLMPDGTLKLFDFGAARDYANEDARSLSVMLKPGYAPEEQYRSRGNQGPWTDVYALCATIYYCITGKAPDDATQRVFSDELQPPSAYGVGISPALEAVLMQGLQIRAENRFRSASELAGAFSAALGFVQPEAPAQENDNTQRKSRRKPAPDRIPQPSAKKKKTALSVSAIIGLCVVGFFIVKFVFFSSPTYITLTDEDMSECRQNFSKTRVVNFENCDFTGVNLPKLFGKMKQVQNIYFINCKVNYAQLDFSANSNLYIINITDEGKVDCSGIMSTASSLSQLYVTAKDITNYDNPGQYAQLNLVRTDDTPAALSAGFSQNLKSNLINFKLNGFDLSAEAENINARLKESPNLNKVDVSRCNLENLEIVRDCERLTTIVADDNPLNDITALENDIHLEVVSLCGADALCSLDGLDNCTLIRTLLVKGSRVSELSALGGCKNSLQTVDLSQSDRHTTLSTAGMEDWVNLINLNISGRRVDSLEINSPRLRVLCADSAELTSLKLSSSENLAYANVANNRLENIDCLIGSTMSTCKIIACSNLIKEVNIEGNNPKMLLVHDNPINSLSVGSNGIIDKLTLDYYEELGDEALKAIKAVSTYDGVVLDEVPMDLRVGIENVLGSSVVSFDGEKAAELYDSWSRSTDLDVFKLS
ncbi:MAG: protein kinase [Oscillospiraceae bacterium]